MALKRMNIKVSEDMHSWVQAEADKRGLTMNAVVIFALETYFAQQQVLPNMGRMLEQLEKEDKK